LEVFLTESRKRRQEDFGFFYFVLEKRKNIEQRRDGALLDRLDQS
jgi:hypothetical protein